MEKHYLELKEFAENQGISLFGVAKVTSLAKYFPLIRKVLASLPYGISIGYRLSDTVLSTVVENRCPSLLYKHHYKTVNWILDQTAERIGNIIQQMGYHSLAIPASQTVDWDRQEGHLSHILVAREAGLGWVGRSGLLVNPKYGAKVRYATILTDLPLEELENGGTEKVKNYGCGSCRECISACPARAISEEGYDKEKCLAKLREFAKIKGIGVYICGVCVAVCKGEKNAKF